MVAITSTAAQENLDLYLHLTGNDTEDMMRTRQFDQEMQQLFSSQGLHGYSAAIAAIDSTATDCEWGEWVSFSNNTSLGRTKMSPLPTIDEERRLSLTKLVPARECTTRKAELLECRRIGEDTAMLEYHLESEDEEGERHDDIDLWIIAAMTQGHGVKLSKLREIRHQ